MMGNIIPVMGVEAVEDYVASDGGHGVRREGWMSRGDGDGGAAELVEADEDAGCGGRGCLRCCRGVGCGGGG